MQQQDTQRQTQNHSQKEMRTQIITLYCLCDDFLRARRWRDDPQAKMSTAEVMTVSLVAAALFDGNQEKSRRFLKEHGYIKTMLSKSRFNRRRYAIPEVLWQGLLWLLGEAAKLANPEGVYAVDSVPIPVCDNIRIRRCRLYPCHNKGKQDRPEDPHWGYCASKRRYYYGLKGHLLVTAAGQPVEFALTPAAIVGFRKLDLDLPAGAIVNADAAYTDYDYEGLLRQMEQVDLLADRKRNSLRQHPACLSYLCQHFRKRIETTFSTVTQWLGRRLHAVTLEEWESKVFLTVLAYAILP